MGGRASGDAARLLPPGEVRETLGWEWVLERWVRRAVEERRQAA